MVTEFLVEVDVGSSAQTARLSIAEPTFTGELLPVADNLHWLKAYAAAMWHK
jgi:hypothetical protein